MTHTPSNPPMHSSGQPYRRVYEIGMAFGVPTYTLGWRMGSSFKVERVLDREPIAGITEWLTTGNLENVR